MKLPYSEGTWFEVPLRQGGVAVGLVTRASIEGKVVLCYFFGPSRSAVPKLAELERLKSYEAVLVARVGDLSIIRGDWPIIGQSTSWKRLDWPVPPFVRRDDLGRRAWVVQYTDDDPNVIAYENPVQYGCKLERDSVFGSGAVELLLTKMLGNIPK